MIKSRFKIIGGFGLLLGLFIVIIFIIIQLLSQPYSNDENDSLPWGFYLFWLLLGAGFVIYQFIIRVNFITIENGILSSTNSIVRTKKVIDLKSIDGFEYKIEDTAGGSYELITLINKDQKLLKISSFYYSNFTEIKNQIQLASNELLPK